MQAIDRSISTWSRKRLTPAKAVTTMSIDPAITPRASRDVPLHELRAVAY